MSEQTAKTARTYVLELKDGTKHERFTADERQETNHFVLFLREGEEVGCVPIDQIVSIRSFVPNSRS